MMGRMLRASRDLVAATHGTHVPSTFLRQAEASDTLALLFPGRGYRATMPLLYYSQQALLARGADVLRLDLAYDLDRAFVDAAPDRQRAILRDDAVAAFQAGIAQRDYRRVVLIGKSLGTLALADVLALDLPRPTISCVWLTPLLNDSALVERIRRHRPRSLFVIGTADPLYDGPLLDELARLTGGRSVIAAQADHSLEVPGNLPASLGSMSAYLAALERFLEAGSAATE